MKEISIGKASWLDIVNPSHDTVDELMAKHHFHELDREAIFEDNQTARVDTYEDYLFVVLHFPKYDTRSKRYLTNEFNIFVSKEYLISLRYFASSTIDRIMERYNTLNGDVVTHSPGYALYEMIDGMLDKVFRMLERFSRELRTLESDLFSGADEALIREIMVKKRNIITLKHMMKPQISALRILELRMNSLFNDTVEVYFENLEDKFQKIFSEIELLQENVESMEATMRSVFDMQTNLTIKYLTIFSAFMLPLTLITSFFGMNIEDVPFHDSFVYSSIAAIVVIMTGALWYFGRRNRV